jgi:succinate dehydrogenase / fumarate reductase membrane anchor subunit
MCHPAIGFADWQDLFSNNIMRVFTLLMLIAVAIHAYIGLWTISTDYLTKVTCLRIGFQVMVWLVLMACVIWAGVILWGA